MKNISRLILVWVAALLCLVAPAAFGQDAPQAFPADQLVLHTDQEAIEFHPQRIDTVLYLPIEDAGIARLLSLNSTAFSWSFDHDTLYIKLAGGDVHWDAGQNKGTIGTADIELPGAVIVRDGHTFISAAALMRFLNLTIIPIDSANGSYSVVPALQSVSADDRPGVGSTLLFSGVGRLTADTLADEHGLLLIFPHTVCQLRGDDLTVGQAHITVQSRGSATTPTSLLVVFPPHWKGIVGGKLLLNQVAVHMVPDYPVGDDDMPNSQLTSMAIESSTADQTVYRLDASGPFAWAWQWDGQSTLNLDLLHGTPLVPPVASQDISNPFITHIDTTTIATDPYSVLRLSFKLAPGSGFKFDKIDNGDVKSLRLTVGAASAVAIAAPQGSDTFKRILHGIIVLDPGHGGSDPGCHSPRTGVREKDVTLDICLRLKDELESRGLKVVLTRSDDRDLTYAGSPDKDELGARAAVANDNNADIFVSVHCNASVSSGPRGMAIHWFKEEDYPLAEVLREGMESASLGVPMNGLIHSRFYVLRHTAVPAVLVETAYLTNPTDGDLLASDGFRAQIAQALANSLAQYMSRVTIRTVRPTFPAASSLH